MNAIAIIIISVLIIIIIFLANRVYWFAKISESIFINQKSEIMKEENQVNLFKQIVGFIFAIVAGVVGYGEAPDLVITFGAILSTVYILTDIVKPYLGTIYIQIFSWIIGILLSVGGWFLQLGIFIDTTWIFAAVTGFVISLIANGVYDAYFLESMWRLIFNRPERVRYPGR